jgi:FkbM family methyltransferase
VIEIFSAYRKYPYKIPLRARVFNVVRYFFKISILERLLVINLAKNRNWWKKLIPPLYFYQRGTIRHANRNGINYLLDLSCLIDYSIFFYTLNEPSWNNLLKLIKIDFIVWDVGANVGFLTLNLARACQNGFVYAFEPDSQSFSTLNQNIQRNNFNNISIKQIALGDKPQKATLYKLYANNPGANRILFQAKQGNFENESVEVTTCDLMMDKLSIHRLDLLKIDVEGFELFVLQGGERLLQRFKPILFIELAEVNLNEHGLTAKMLIEYIENLSYSVLDAKTMDSIDKLKANHHTDMICFSKS